MRLTEAAGRGHIAGDGRKEYLPSNSMQTPSRVAGGAVAEFQMSDTVELAPVGLTPRAAKQVCRVLSREPAGALLRVAVNGGGCSGFQYAFDIVQAREPDDLVVERDGAVVLIDPVSLEYMRGSNIDYVDDLIGQAFKIENPNATASCGCGTSFAL